VYLAGSCGAPWDDFPPFSCPRRSAAGVAPSAAPSASVNDWVVTSETVERGEPLQTVGRSVGRWQRVDHRIERKESVTDGHALRVD